MLSTNRIDDTVAPYNGPCQGNPFSSGRGEKFVLKTGLSKGNPNMREDNGLVQNNDPFQGHSPSTSELSTTTNGTQRAATHTKLEHWNAHGEITKDLCNQDSHRSR